MAYVFPCCPPFLVCNIFVRCFYLSPSFFFFLLALAFESPHMFVPPWVDGMFSMAIPCNIVSCLVIWCIRNIYIILYVYLLEIQYPISMSGWYVQYSYNFIKSMCPETWREGPSLSCKVIPSHCKTQKGWKEITKNLLLLKRIMNCVSHSSLSLSLIFGDTARVHKIIKACFNLVNFTFNLFTIRWLKIGETCFTCTTFTFREALI